MAAVLKHPPLHRRPEEIGRRVIGSLLEFGIKAMGRPPRDPQKALDPEANRELERYFERRLREKPAASSGLSWRRD